METAYEATTVDDSIVGSKIVDIRPMTANEMESEGWQKNEIPMVLVL